MSCRPTLLWLFLTTASAGCERPAWPGEPADTWAPAERLDLCVTLEAGSGEPLAGAWAILDPTGRDRLTDEAGLACFHALDPGSYTVEGAANRYQLGRAEAVLDSEDLSFTLTLEAQDESRGAGGGAR